MNIQEIATLDKYEIVKISEKIMANYPADDHNHLSWGESADLIEAQAESQKEVNDAKTLRAVEARWFELEA